MFLKEISWFVGVLLAIAANIISNIGLNVQKKAHSARRERSRVLSQTAGQDGQPFRQISIHRQTSIMSRQTSISVSIVMPGDDSDQPSYVCDAVWLLGLLLQVIGAIFDFAALAFAPQSVVAPLGALTLVINVCLAPIMQKEWPSNKTIAATFIIVAGCVITVVFSAKGNDLRKVDDVFAMYRAIEFLCYGVVTGGYMIILWSTVQFALRMGQTQKKLYQTKYFKIHRFAISALSGTMGAQNILFAKGASTLLLLTIEGEGMMFVHYQTYMILAALFCSVYFQLRWLNASLKRFSSLQIVPIFQSHWVLVSVLGGLAVYQEFGKMDLMTKIIFPFGILMVIGGVAYLTTQSQPYKRKTSKKSDSQLKCKPEQTHTTIEICPPTTPLSTSNGMAPPNTKTINGEEDHDHDPDQENQYNSTYIIPATSMNNYKKETDIESHETIGNEITAGKSQPTFNNEHKLISPRANIRERKANEHSTKETKALKDKKFKDRLWRHTSLPLVQFTGNTSSLNNNPTLSERMVSILPSPQRLISKTYAYGEAAMISGTSLGRLLVQPDVLLKGSDLGVYGPDQPDIADDENSNDTELCNQPLHDPSAIATGKPEELMQDNQKRNSAFQIPSWSEQDDTDRKNAHVKSSSSNNSVSPNRTDHITRWKDWFHFKKDRSNNNNNNNNNNNADAIVNPNAEHNHSLINDTTNILSQPLTIQGPPIPELASNLDEIDAQERNNVASNLPMISLNDSNKININSLKQAKSDPQFRPS